MIIPSSVDTQLMVTYDDDVYNIGFSNFNAVDRVAITSKDQRKIVVEYLMPSVSGGAIAKRILQQPATIGEFTISGKGSVDVGGTSSYQSNATPDASDVVYAWTIEQEGSEVATSKAEVTSGADATGCTVSWKEAGNYDVKCVITSNTAGDSPQEDTRAVVCSVVQTVGTATISSGSATPEAEKAETYAVTVSGNNVNDLTYVWSVLDATAQITSKNSASTGITFDAPGNATIQCIVGSDSIPDTDSTTKSVVVDDARTIGTVTVDGGQGAQANTAVNYQAHISGNIIDAAYTWTVSPDDGTFIITDASAESTNITFNATGSYEVRCKVTSATAQNSPQTSAPFTVAVSGLPGIVGVTLGGPQDVADLDEAKNYTSKVSDDSTLVGTTTYKWTAKDVDTDETTGIGVAFGTATSQNTTVTYSADSVGRTIKLNCKYTNNAYETPTKTGARNVTVADDAS